MILAGVLLKLGGYGIFKTIIFILSIIDIIRGVILRLSIYGSVIVRLICLRQVDMKCLVAYSSIVHMGPVLLSLILFSWGA